jgi:hypothetical protein
MVKVVDVKIKETNSLNLMIVAKVEIGDKCSNHTRKEDTVKIERINS